MRRRKDARVRSSAGQVGSQGVRKSRLASRKAAHSAKSDISGTRSTTPSPTMAGIRSDKLTVRKKAIATSDHGARATKNGMPFRPLLRHRSSGLEHLQAA